MIQTSEPSHQLLFFSLFAIAFMFSSCSETMIAADAQNAGLVEISLPGEGSVLKTYAEFPVGLQFDSSRVTPAEIEIELYDKWGGFVDRLLVPYSAQDNIFKFGDFPEGPYTLKVFVREEDGTLAGEKSVIVFHTDDEYGIWQVSCYPPTVEPDSDILFFADFLYPGLADPYVRWTFDKNVITEGLLSETGNSLQWKVPKKPGMYVLNVELFPFSPAGISSRAVSAPYSMQGNVFAMNRVDPSQNELSPEDAYFLLQHFRGNFRNYGTGKDYSFQIEGSPKLALQDGIFGYRFDEDSGLVYSKNPLQPDEQGNIDSVVQINALFDQNHTDTDIFSIGNDLVLSKVPAGFVLHFFENTFSYTHEGGYIMLGMRFVQKDNTLLLEWYDDGVFRRSDILGDRESLRNLSGIMRVGFGIPGILDEFGIIQADSHGILNGIDLFMQAMNIRYGSSLVLAESFGKNIDDIDSRLSLNNPDFVEVSDGKLYLDPEALIYSSGFDISSGGIELIIGSGEGQAPFLFMETASGREEIVLTRKNGNYHARVSGLSRPDAANEFIAPETGVISIEIAGPGNMDSLVIIRTSNEHVQPSALLSMP